MSQDIMNLLVAKVEALPPMPQSVFKLREAVAKPDVNYNQIVAPLKDDPGICADLLRVANSARYGVSHKVDTVEEAVRYFGMPSLVEFVAAACSERIIRESFSNISNLNEFVHHSRVVAQSTAYICALLKMNPHASEVFSVSGLLHDIGRLLTLLVTGERHFCKEAVGVYWDELSPEIASEVQIYGLNHAELGRLICEKWQFPPRIINAVHRHHTPLMKEDFSFDGMIIYMAELLITEELPDAIVARSIPASLMRELKIGPDDIISTRKALLLDLAH
jgi:putative nucleotidyltransferase with HDIG domain